MYFATLRQYVRRAVSASSSPLFAASFISLKSDDIPPERPNTPDFLFNINYFYLSILFVEKNKKGESTLYTLADIKARSDASFAKDYMAGKYGAIPVLSDEDLYTETVGEWLCQD